MLSDSGRCRRCGTAVSESTRFCPHCGARVGQQSQGFSVLKVLSGLLLALVAIFLGALGACFVIFGVSALTGGASGFLWAVLSWLVAAVAFVGMVKVLR